MKGKQIKTGEKDYRLYVNKDNIPNDVVRVVGQDGRNPHEVIVASTEKPSRYLELSLKNCQAVENGYDLEELAEKEFPLLDESWCRTGAVHEENLQLLGHRNSFQKGFKKALEILGDKKFSEDDVKKVIESTISNCSVKRVRNRYIPDELLDEVECNLSEEDIIQSLQQTEWDVEVETIEYGLGNDKNGRPVFETRYLFDADGRLILKRIEL